MKKIFSFFAAVLFAGSMMAAYTAQQVSNVEAGAKYIFERNKRVLIGTVTSSKLQTTADYQSLNGDENYIWTLETADGGFYLKQGEKYLKNSSSSNVSLVASGGSVWKFEFTDGVALISNVSNNDRYIGETVEGSNEYKAYSTQNMTYGHDFTVYELVEETPKTPAEVLQGYINDLTLIKDFILGYDASVDVSAIATAIGAAQGVLESGDEAAIQALNNLAAENKAKFIDEAISQGKAALLAGVENLAQEGDNEQCVALIDAAKELINNAAWDETKSVEENLAAFKEVGEETYKELVAALELARNSETIALQYDLKNADIQWVDAVADEGWWQIMVTSNDEKYMLFLCNAGEVKQAWATYTVDQLDPQYTGMYVGDDLISFVAGSVTVSSTEAGVVTIEGSLTGSDYNVYEINIVYDPSIPVELTISSITSPGAVEWIDAVADEGWWQIIAQSGNNEIYICSVEGVTAVAGTYGIDDLDADYTGLTVGQTDYAFTSGSVTVNVDEAGTVTVVGELVASDGRVYKVNLTFVEPKVEKTVEVNIANGALDGAYVDYGLYAIYGEDANGVYVQLAIWADNAFEGDFTQDDFDEYFAESFISEGETSVVIYTAAIHVTPGKEEGEYTIVADLVGYNNTLYKVTMQIPAPAPAGISNALVTGKARKALRNGHLVIERAGRTFNVQGAQIR